MGGLQPQGVACFGLADCGRNHVFLRLLRSPGLPIETGLPVGTASLLSTYG